VIGLGLLFILVGLGFIALDHRRRAAPANGPATDALPAPPATEAEPAEPAEPAVPAAPDDRAPQPT
jgi:hypothetical protein